MLPSYYFGAEGVEYGRKAPFYVPSSGPLNLPSDLLVKGTLTVEGASILNGATVVNNNLTVSGNETVGGAVTILGGTGGIGLTVGQSGAVRDLVVTGTAFTGPINAGIVTATQAQVGTGGVSTTGSLVTGSSTVPGGAIYGYDGSALHTPNFPLGLASQGAVSGFNSVRSRVVNVSDNVIDDVIFWDGVTTLVTGVITGAGPNFTVFFQLPADIATNPVYRGMTIFNSDISIPSTTRTVIFAIRDSTGTQLLSTTLSSLSQWEVNAKLGAPGNTNNPLGLFLTTNSSANMVAI